MCSASSLSRYRSTIDGLGLKAENTDRAREGIKLKACGKVLAHNGEAQQRASRSKKPSHARTQKSPNCANPERHSLTNKRNKSNATNSV